MQLERYDDPGCHMQSIQLHLSPLDEYIRVDGRFQHQDASFTAPRMEQSAQIASTSFRGPLDGHHPNNK